MIAANGRDKVIDQGFSDVTVQSADGSKVQTVMVSNADGQRMTVVDADRESALRLKNLHHLPTNDNINSILTAA